MFGYAGVGGAAACVDALTFYLACYHWHFHYLAALAIGFVPGVLTNFCLCHLVFYRVGRSFVGTWSRHCLSAMFSFCVNAGVMSLLIYGFHFRHFFLARVMAIFVSFFVSFCLIRYFAFQDHKRYVETG